MRVVYKDHKSWLHELFEKDDSCKIHEINLQNLVVGIFKVKINLASEIKNDVFEIVKCPCSLRN